MTSTIAMFRASMLSLVRDRQLVGGIVAFPLIFLLAFAAFDLRISGAELGAPAGVDYYRFVVPGLLAMTSMDFAVSWTAASYARLQDAGVLRRLRVTPIRPAAFLAGQVSARALVAGVQAIVVLAVAAVLGANFTSSIVLLVGLSLLGTAAFMPIGFAIGARSSGVESASVLAGMVVLPIVFLSGAFFPKAGLPDWLEPVVDVLPMVPLLDAMRAVAIDGADVADVAAQIGLVAAWVPVTFGVAVVAMRVPGRRAVRPASSSVGTAAA